MWVQNATEVSRWTPGMEAYRAQIQPRAGTPKAEKAVPQDLLEISDNAKALAKKKEAPAKESTPLPVPGRFESKDTTLAFGPSDAASALTRRYDRSGREIPPEPKGTQLFKGIGNFLDVVA